MQERTYYWIDTKDGDHLYQISAFRPSGDEMYQNGVHYIGVDLRSVSGTRPSCRRYIEDKSYFEKGA